MTLTDQINRAMERAKAKMDARDLLAMVRRGEAHLISLGTSSISWRFIQDEDGEALEVIHAFGYWSDRDFYLGALGDAMRQRGVNRITWLGRPGWPRLLGRA